MQEDGGKDLKSLIKIFIGPQYDLTQNDINELKHAGYIWQEKNNSPIETISLRFQSYLMEEARRDLNLDIWPLLTEPEKLLRNAIEAKLRGNLGEEWEKELIKEAHSYAAQNTKFIGLEKIDDYMNSRVQTNRLIDNLSFIEYGNIIKKYYGFFQNDFKIGYDKFRKLTGRIQDVRNPYAHSNGELVSDLIVQEADLACKKLIAMLNPIVSQ